MRPGGGKVLGSIDRAGGGGSEDIFVLSGACWCIGFFFCLASGVCRSHGERQLSWAYVAVQSATAGLFRVSAFAGASLVL